MPSGVAQSFGTPNFSGMLFNKSNTETPFSTMIGARRLFTDHVEFSTGIEYATEGGTQPSISETASLTAPSPTHITREQLANVTQIFHESLGISYAKQSNMGTMSGINIANQSANPADEWAFQVQAKMAKIAQDIEYTFLNGDYAKATNDTQANKTRGLLTAITSNIVDANSDPLNFMVICEAIKSIKDAHGNLSNLVLGLDAVNKLQLNADAVASGMTIVDSGRSINGINVLTVLTPLGNVNIADLKYLPAGTAVLFDPNVLNPVEQPVPGKGNFFLEELSRTGAGATAQIFGQIGLDHGPEWYSAKIEGLSTAMPENTDFSKRVQQVNP